MDQDGELIKIKSEVRSSSFQLMLRRFAKDADEEPHPNLQCCIWKGDIRVTPLFRYHTVLNLLQPATRARYPNGLIIHRTLYLLASMNKGSLQLVALTFHTLKAPLQCFVQLLLPRLDLRLPRKKRGNPGVNGIRIFGKSQMLSHCQIQRLSRNIKNLLSPCLVYPW